MAERHGIETLELGDDSLAELRDRTDGRGPDSIVDAVGMEAHGNPGIGFMQKATTLLPDAIAKKVMTTGGADRLAALHLAIDAVRRGGTVSLSGVYAGVGDPLPMKTMFDKGITVRMGQCNVQKWRDELVPIVEDPADPLGTEDLVTHSVPLDRAPEMYKTFKEKTDGCIKVVLKP